MSFSRSASEVVEALCDIWTFSTRPPPSSAEASVGLPGALLDLGAVFSCWWCGAGAADRCFLAGFVGLDEPNEQTTDSR